MSTQLSNTRQDPPPTYSSTPETPDGKVVAFPGEHKQKHADTSTSVDAVPGTSRWNGYTTRKAVDFQSSNPGVSSYALSSMSRPIPDSQVSMVTGKPNDTEFGLQDTQNVSMRRNLMLSPHHSGIIIVAILLAGSAILDNTSTVAGLCKATKDHTDMAYYLQIIALFGLESMIYLKLKPKMNSKRVFWVLWSLEFAAMTTIIVLYAITRAEIDSMRCSFAAH